MPAVYSHLSGVVHLELTTTQRDTQHPDPPMGLVILNQSIQVNQIFITERDWQDFLIYYSNDTPPAEGDIVQWDTTDERWELLSHDRLLSGGAHTDTKDQAVIEGDLMVGSGDSPPVWQRKAFAAPVAGNLNIFAAQSSDTAGAWNTAFDDTANPLDVAASSSDGVRITFSRNDHVHAHPTSLLTTVSKSILFASPNINFKVETWLPDQAVRVPASGKHGTWVAGTVYVRCGTAGTGTNTILFRTSTTLTGARTTRATVALGTNREASASITWTPADGEYMWIEVSAVGGTAPKRGIVQVDIEETAY